jgi:hypothetical protein
VEPQRIWYGWQTALADTGWVVLFLSANSISSQTQSRGEGQALVGLAAIDYLGGAPAIHWAHGHVGRGFASMGLRLGSPMLGAMLGIAAAATSARSGNGQAALDDIGLGVLLGIVATPIVDLAFLAFDDPPSPDSPDAPSTSALRFTPVATLPRDASGRFAPTLGLGGAF